MHSNYEKEDTMLVEACISKDAAAWSLLVKKYTALISASIANRLKKYGFNPACQDTEDIFQEVLASIWIGGKLCNVRNRKSIAYWLAIVSGNAAIEHMRKKIAGGTLNPIQIADAENIESPASDTPRKRELSEKIDSSIDLLPEKERLVIKLNLLHGMEYREISEILKMPKGTVSSCIKRAKEKLREELKDF
ncbi:MAG: sigma-70 family RNA polymerase sigma factor [Candidatus Omnitrophota bacterium]